MSIAKVVVPLTGADRDKAAIETAFVAAKPNGHVVGLFISADPRLALPYMGTPLSPDVVQAIVDSTDEMNREAAKVARKTLADAAGAAKVEFLDAPRRSSSVSCSFRKMEGYFPQCVSEASQLSDLIVFGPISPADGPDLADAFVEALVKTERPVLLASRAPKSLTGHVTLAWDGSAIAARALMAAMPFLEQAGKITLLSCHTANAAKPHSKDVAEYLSLKGLACTPKSIEPGKHGIGQALLDAAAECGSDLLVMGGFGHSHLSEVFFGGVTQHIRWHAELPVLMAH